MHWAVILAGGSGTRFWPLSTPSRPKHLIPLAGSLPTAAQAVRAVEPLIPRERMLVVTGAALADLLPTVTGLPRSSILVEPRAASTGPALVWATLEAHRRDPDALVLSLHADWHLGDGEAFRATARAALEAAARYDALVTTGIVPSRAEPGYGHLVPGDALGPGVRRVARFVEKPKPAAARKLMDEGALWNSGLFAWTARRLTEEIRQHTPEVASALPKLEAGDVAGFFQEVTPISIDVGLLERSGRVACVSGDFPWDDIGSWSALARIGEPDARGNLTEGPVHVVASHDCIAWSDSLPVVLTGVHDLVVVCANGRILVMPRSQAGALKDTLEALPSEVRDLA